MWDSKLNITVEPGQRVWFTSDLHLGHKNVLKFASRPWNTMGEMKRGLFSNWNSRVSDRDIVFILGDFYYHDSRSELQNILGNLRGQKIYFIPGNHDKPRAWEDIPERVEVLDCITTVYFRGVVTCFPQISFEAILCHYPLLTWPHYTQYGNFHLYGHIHSGPHQQRKDYPKDALDVPGKNFFPPKDHRMYDVGVDNNNYYPVSLYSILRKFNIQPNWSSIPGISKREGYNPQWKGLVKDLPEWSNPAEALEERGAVYYPLEEIPKDYQTKI